MMIFVLCRVSSASLYIAVSQAPNPLCLFLIIRLNLSSVLCVKPIAFKIRKSAALYRATGPLKTRRQPIFPGSRPPSIVGATELNFRVRNGNGWVLCAIITGCTPLNLINVRGFLAFSLPCSFVFTNFFWSSPRPISIAQLHTLLHLHLRPINHVVYMGSY